MTYPPGYPQAPGYPPGYPQGSGFPPPRQASSATAVLSAATAIAGAGLLIYLGVDAFVLAQDWGLDQLPNELLLILGWQFVSAVVLILGGVLIFARKGSGPVLTIIGAVGALSSVVAEPLILHVDPDLYFAAMFDFDRPRQVLVAVALLATVIALLFSIMPSTFRWTRGAQPAPAGYPPAGQQQGW